MSEQRWPAFETMVRRNQDVDVVPTDIVELQVGGAHATIRKRGAMVLGATLVNGQGEATPVLFGSQAEKPKARATHLCAPFGSMNGADEKHGVPRWLDYEHALQPTPGGQAAILWAGEQREAPVRIERHVTLLPRLLSMDSVVKNIGHKVQRTSLAEHFYFHLPDPEIGIAKMEVLGQPINDLLQDTRATQKILEGKPQVWHSYPGATQISFAPDGPAIDLNTSVHVGLTGNEQLVTEEDDLPTDIIFWHCKGTQSICVEPVVGAVFSKEGSLVDNTRLPIQLGYRASIASALYLY